MSAGRFHDLRAHAALAGYQLMRTAAEDGELLYLVVRWGHVKSLGSLADVVTWLERAGVQVPDNLTEAAA